MDRNQQLRSGFLAILVMLTIQFLIGMATGFAIAVVSYAIGLDLTAQYDQRAGVRSAA